MADIFGTALSLSSRFNLGNISITQTGIADFAVAYPQGIPYIFAIEPDATSGGTAVGTQVRAFTIDDAGVLSQVGTLVDDATTQFGNGFTIETVRYANLLGTGNSFVIPVGFNDDGFSVYSISPFSLFGPSFTLAGSAFDAQDPGYLLNGAFAITSYVTSPSFLNFDTFVVVAGFNESGLNVFELDSSGAPTPVQQIADGASAQVFLQDVGFLQEVSLSGENYILAISSTQNTISIFEKTSSGALQIFYGTEDFLSRDFDDIAATVIDDRILYYTSDSFRNAITVFESDSINTVEVQRLSSDASLQGVTGLEVIEHGDARFLVASSSSSDKVALFRINTDGINGQLGALSVVEIGAASEFGFNSPVDSTTIQVGDKTFLLVEDVLNDEIAVFEIGGGDDMLTGTSEDDRVLGFGGDDILTALEGDDDIDGGKGDDVIYAGSGDDMITGGDGDDTVFGGAGDDTIKIGAGEDSTQGGSGTDLITAEFLDVLTKGVEIDFIRNEVILEDGTRQFISGVEDSIGTFLGDRLIGSDGANTITAGAGADVVRGRAGDDLLSGGDGDDLLVGADGVDTLLGGLGNDRLAGGNGDDELKGGAGEDRLFGGGGDDLIDGGGDDDLLKGNGGNDEVLGGGGADRIEGNQGDDFLRGQGGNDTIIGGGGRDLINGGAGNDTLTGGSAMDTFVFQQVANGGGGTNVIEDFQDGLDLLDFTDYGFPDPTLALLGAVQSGDDVQITMADAQVIILRDMLLADVTAADVIVFGIT